jgi:tripartite-type tricarboxylate transporter receptor subunit TctC
VSSRETAGFAALLCWAAITTTHAQTFPSRPLRIISPFAAGGSNDVVARLIGARLSDALGQPVIVENRAGAGGVVGTEFGARAAPDGHTLTMVTNATLAIVPALQKTSYDPQRDFAPVGLVGASPYIIVVHPSIPARTMQQLLTLIRARPKQVEFGSGGIGTPGHLAGAMLNTMTGTAMIHVPYKAGNLALNDLLGGHISVTFSNTITVSELIKAGRVRAIAATSAKRISAFPDLPTVAESGVPGYEFTLWLGLAVPGATPASIVQPLNKSLVKTLQDKILHERFAAQSIDVLTSTPQEFADKIKHDIGIYAKLVKAAGARVE